MKRTGRITGLLLVTAAVGQLSAEQPKGGDGGLIKDQASPHARVHSVNLGSVRWTDGFWARRFDTAAEVTLPALWDLAADPEAGHAWQNMRIAAGLEKGERRGSDWQDAWLYKWVESASYVFQVTHDAELDARMDEVIAVIAQAQQPDGYIATQTQIRPNLGRYESENHHELYTMGHLITAACMHYRITGKVSFLEVAKRTADHIYKKFKDRDPALANFPVNPSIIMAGVELYRTTGVKDYLDMAISFVDGRGSAYGKGRRSIWGKLETVEANAPFVIRLRGPGWVEGASLTINGEAAAEKPVPGSYVAAKRKWRAGDIIELNLPMPVRMIAADPRLQENRHQVAVQRGPIVYCLESTDLPDGVRFEDVHLRRGATWKTRHEQGLLGGVTVLETEGVAIKTYDGSAGLYGDLPKADPRPIEIRMIPYYAWNNRGEPKMSVWNPLD